MKGSTGKFGLVNEENLICSAFNVLRRRRDIVIEHPLHGDFIDVHFAVFFLQRLVFINGVTCFRSRFYVEETLSTKNAIQAQTALLHVEMSSSSSRRDFGDASHKNIPREVASVSIGCPSIPIFSSAKSFNRATSSFLVKKN